MIQNQEVQNSEIVINVYYSGTGHQIGDENLAACLYAMDTTSTDARTHDQKTLTNQAKVKFGFDGCGVTHGVIFGLIFGAGVKTQAREVERFVRQSIRAGKTVKLNVFGHSRGGISAIILAWYLRDILKTQLQTRLALHDPVPGNFRFWTWLDRLLFGWNLANQSMDLSKSKNLVKVDAVYPQKPLEFYAAHAPIMPTYPTEDCVVTEAVIGGYSIHRAFAGEIWCNCLGCFGPGFFSPRVCNLACGGRTHS